MNIKTIGIGAIGLVGIGGLGIGFKKIADNHRHKKLEKSQAKELDLLQKKQEELTKLIVKNQEVAERWSVNVEENFKETLRIMSEIKAQYDIKEDIDIDPREYDVTIETI